MENSTDGRSNNAERFIVEELRRWAALTKSERGSYHPSPKLHTAVEYFLSNAFHCKNSSKSGGWWCDGVHRLSLHMLAPLTMRLRGVADWATHDSPFYFAPFELVIQLGSAESPLPERVVVRFGKADRFGDIERTPMSADVESVLRNRPTQDADWAFAVELT